MPIKYRIFQDGDESGIDKLFHSAFCKTRFCQPRTLEFWDWKYKKRPPRFIPEGIMIAEKNGIIVGSVIVTFHKMRFGDQEFLFGGIDDVATCPILEKRGIARNLMERAIEFTKNYGADGSVLMADPGGHARKLYKRLGYIYKIYYSLFMKIINPLKFRKEIFPLFPFFPLFYLLKLKAKRRKRAKNIQFEIQKGEQLEFIKKINEHNKNFIGGNVYDKNYWHWFKVNRPKRDKSINLAIKRGRQLIGGGSILKSYTLILKYYLSSYVLADFFIDLESRIYDIGYSLLNKLEAIAAMESPVMMAFVHDNHFHLTRLLKENGYFSIKKADLEMILPISKDFIQIYESLKEVKKAWLPPLEQAGF